MFESLSGKIEKAFKTLKGQGKISEINVAETVKEIRKALIDADVNFKIAKQFTDTVKEKALAKRRATAAAKKAEKDKDIRATEHPKTTVQGEGPLAFQLSNRHEKN